MSLSNDQRVTYVQVISGDSGGAPESEVHDSEELAMRIRFIVTIAAALLALSGALAQAAQTPTAEQGYTIEGATISELIDANGATIGQVVVAPSEDGVAGMVLVQGLEPGEHGIHLHSVGACDPTHEKPFDSAGSHFNPGEMHHGMHAGDLGNLTIDAGGNGVYAFGSGTWTLDAGMFGLADADGTALVIHETVDDLVTDPSGNSGSRIACAVLFPPRS
jgi:Cu-Zn family superoxide dismutase